MCVGFSLQMSNTIQLKSDKIKLDFNSSLDKNKMIII